MRIRYKIAVLLAAWALGWGSASGAAAETGLSKAEALIKAGKLSAAYDVLAAMAFAHAGEVNFDYLLGVTALEVGKPDRATLAFERVLAVDPNFAGARVDMGRAYFALGDYSRARAELRIAAAQNPPPAAKKVIQDYLAEIERRLNPATTFAGYLEGTLGYDDNVNNSANTSKIYVPLFGVNMTLSPTNVKSRDNYLSVGGGGELTHPLRRGLSLFVGADGKKRVNFFKDQFNTGAMDGRIGLNIGEGRNVVRVAVQKSLFYLDDKFNRETTGFVGEWRHGLNAANQLSVYGQYSMLRYGHDKSGADLSDNDVNLNLGGVGWLHAIGGNGKAIVFASLYAGVEKTTGPIDRPDGDQRFRGVRLGGQDALNGRWAIFVFGGVKAGNYMRRNAVFLDWRHDDQYDVTVGANWRPARHWTVRPQASYTRNDSNFALNDYDRTDVSVTVRRDFK